MTALNFPFLVKLTFRRLGGRSVLRVGIIAVTAIVVSSASLALTGCGIGPRSAVSMKVARAKSTPKDASVYIDEEYIGPLYYVAAHGVRLPTGKHRITVTRDGYFPWDREIIADRQPIFFDVELVAVPD